MNAIWRTIRGYILWSYERGTIHYDIMVTLILIFVFLSPYWINFNDKPIELRFSYISTERYEYNSEPVALS